MILACLTSNLSSRMRNGLAFSVKYISSELRRANYLMRGRGENLVVYSSRYRSTLQHRLATGEWTDPDVEDPLTKMFTFLSEKKDRNLIQQWGVWLTKQDSERAIKLLTSLGGRRQNRQEDDLALLQQIQESDASAGAQYLEHLVLQKRSQVCSVYFYDMDIGLTWGLRRTQRYTRSSQHFTWINFCLA